MRWTVPWRCPPGCVTGLIGQNGAGKSTTFKAVLGLIKRDEGRITLLGKDLDDFTARDREQLGIVLSDSGFSGYLTIRDLAPMLQAFDPPSTPDGSWRR